jgi:hypothetical protein
LDRVNLFPALAFIFLLALVVLLFVLPLGSFDGNWSYNVAGVGLLTSVFTVLIIVGGFAIDVSATAFRLAFNQWVYNVEDMRPFFNPVYFLWLYANDREGWAFYQILILLPFSYVFGTMLFVMIAINQVSTEAFSSGTLIGIVISGVFSLLLYKAYVSTLHPTEFSDEVVDSEQHTGD